MILCVEYDKKVLTNVQALRLIDTFIALKGEEKTYGIGLNRPKFKITKSKSALIEECYTIEEVK